MNQSMLNPALPDVLKIIMMKKELYISLTNNAIDHKFSEFSPTVPSPLVGKAEKKPHLVVWLIIITSKFHLFANTFFSNNKMKMEIACKGSTVLQTKTKMLDKIRKYYKIRTAILLEKTLHVPSSRKLELFYLE